MLTLHPSLTVKRVERAARKSTFDDSYIGFCIACGRKAKQPCEPDAREYPCSYCKQHTVYGAEELLIETVG